MPHAKASEVLIQAKALFGRHGQRWIQGRYHSQTVLGDDTYCSLGAVMRITGDNYLTGNSHFYEAVGFLDKAIYLEAGRHIGIAEFNDAGLPFFKWFRWRRIKKVWCRAIKMAIDAEEAEETKCSQPSFS